MAASGCSWNCGGGQGLQLGIAAGGKRLRGEQRTAGVLGTTMTGSCSISRSPPSNSSGSGCVASAPPPPRPRQLLPSGTIKQHGDRHRRTSRLQVRPGLQALRYDALLAGSQWFRVVRGGVEAF